MVHVRSYRRRNGISVRSHTRSGRSGYGGIGSRRGNYSGTTITESVQRQPVIETEEERWKREEQEEEERELTREEKQELEILQDSHIKRQMPYDNLQLKKHAKYIVRDRKIEQEKVYKKYSREPGDEEVRGKLEGKRIDKDASTKQYLLKIRGDEYYVPYNNDTEDDLDRVRKGADVVIRYDKYGNLKTFGW
jgi:hypothetical protein